jgi:pimeloyl-ACP methyl ester carboxylesterase
VGTAAGLACLLATTGMAAEQSVAAPSSGTRSALREAKAPPHPQPPDSRPHSSAQDKASVTTESCRAGQARCGEIHRLLDPREPNGRRIRIGFELYHRQDRSRPGLGTIVAVEGGPGYATRASRAYYLDLFEPLMKRRQLLLVDNRGTGSSARIRCPLLQSYQGNRNFAIARCGHKLGATSDLYGSAFAADDLAAVLDRLGIGRVDLYGDSYGTFFGQTFALRHPDKLRTLILDAAYFVGGKDPWYSDTNRAMRHAFTVACRRSPACAKRGGAPMQRIARLVQRLREQPIAGRAPNADGLIRRIRVTPATMITILTAAATTPGVYRELDAAARAVLRPHPYTRPLLRLARETYYAGTAGAARYYSEGLYVAVACNDYPQPYDVTAPRKVRQQQYEQAIRRLSQNRPGLFGPFGVREWISSPYGYYDDCLRWPAPDRWVHPVPAHATYPDVPTLVFGGDLDSLTSPEGARATASAFPDATFVETANMVHVSALVDFDACASVIVRRFVRTGGDAGDTSCAKRYHENRLVDRFERTAAQTGWQGPRYRTSRVAAATVADVVARWWSMYGTQGVGLQGGTFSVHGGYFRGAHPVVTWRLDQVRWVRDVAVSGQVRWFRHSGLIRARVQVTGPGAPPSDLTLRWNDLQRHPRALAQGRVDGHRIRFVFPAP